MNIVSLILLVIIVMLVAFIRVLWDKKEDYKYRYEISKDIQASVLRQSARTEREMAELRTELGIKRAECENMRKLKNGGRLLSREESRRLMSDNVNHPNHYQGDIETIDYIKDKLTDEEFRGFVKGNVLKYVSREGLKNGDEDLKKARWYLNELLEVEE
ncbi:DUF3310 domain-containing protein [Tetragenococcus koreensis]|uniref:DUF3310 domain-containing protein n=1 Tax=Tetragenococcus koreensis TaxID=290335 RepID=UPI001F2783F8|nr:DUF3310 domain-containing protein [Tetragenococcus koreensis]MCF1632926.1 DUF3310 domain-containing protein [Tetragenococcus koreensis]